MPTAVKKEGDEYAIYDKNTGKKKGSSKSKRKAHISAAIRDRKSGHMSEGEFLSFYLDFEEVLQEAVLDRQEAQGGFEFERAFAREREARELVEAVAAAAFDPAEHPRNRLGRFRDVLGKLARLAVFDERRSRSPGLPLSRTFHSAHEIGAHESQMRELVHLGAVEETVLPSGQVGYRKRAFALATFDPGTTDPRGPRAGDRAGQAAAADHSAARATEMAAQLRAQRNEEHAQDYDGIARNMRARAARLRGGDVVTGDPGLYYDKELDDQVGYRDALAGRPRDSTASGYRRGYDRGFTERLNQEPQDVNVSDSLDRAYRRMSDEELALYARSPNNLERSRARKEIARRAGMAA